jgi:hypothetical protein
VFTKIPSQVAFMGGMLLCSSAGIFSHHWVEHRGGAHLTYSVSDLTCTLCHGGGCLMCCRHGCREAKPGVFDGSEQCMLEDKVVAWTHCERGLPGTKRVCWHGCMHQHTSPLIDVLPIRASVASCWGTGCAVRLFGCRGLG